MESRDFKLNDTSINECSICLDILYMSVSPLKESHFNQLLRRSCLMSHQNSSKEIYFCSGAGNVKQISRVLVIVFSSFSV